MQHELDIIIELETTFQQSINYDIEPYLKEMNRNVYSTKSENHI